MVDKLKKGESVADLFKESLAIEERVAIPVSRGEPRPRPIIEVVNVHVNAFFPFDIKLVQPFVKIARVIAFHAWDGTQLNYAEFMGGANGQKFLVNGLQIAIDDRNLFPDPIHAMQDYMRYAFDTDVIVDTLGVNKRIYFTARLSFHKFMGNLEGINATDYDIVVRLADNVSAFGVNGISTWAFEGWGWDR